MPPDGSGVVGVDHAQRKLSVAQSRMQAIAHPRILHAADDAAVIVQEESSGPQLYFIQFRRDGLGRWLIEEM